MKQMDAQVQANKERAQAEADVLVDEKRLQSNMMIEEQKLNYQTQSDLTDAQLKEMEIQSKREIDLAEIETKIKIEMAKLSAQNSGDENVSNGNESAMLAELLQTIQAQMVAPRRLIKDENGDIIGAETIL